MSSEEKAWTPARRRKQEGRFTHLAQGVEGLCCRAGGLKASLWGGPARVAGGGQIFRATTPPGVQCGVIPAQKTRGVPMAPVRPQAE